MSSVLINTTLSKPITDSDGYHHLVYSISGTTHTIFLDNSAIAINASAGNIFTNYQTISNSFIGIAGDLSYGYTGFIDEFKIFNRALTTTDINAIYNNVNISLVTASVVGASVIPITSLSKSYVAFTSTTNTNTIIFNENVTANVFMIGGGGAGTGPYGGGGGAGAYYNSTFTFNANTTYTIKVGAGGVYTGQSIAGVSGEITKISVGVIDVIKVNGGGGGVSASSIGVNGGCGGGAGGMNTTTYVGGTAANTNTNGNGFAGGSKTTNYSGGGGGGAGGVGQNAGARLANALNGGNGGDAIVVNLKGFSEAYGGGGGGGSRDDTGGTQAVGGSVLVNSVLTYVGGYGNRCVDGSTIIVGTPPVANTGSGGGGGGAFSTYGTNGSAGIVIIQFNNTNITTTPTTPTFKPSSIIGLQLWLDATNSSDFSTSSGTLTWKDKSETNHNAVSNSTTTIVRNTSGHYPYVYFNADTIENASLTIPRSIR